MTKPKPKAAPAHVTMDDISHLAADEIIAYRERETHKALVKGLANVTTILQKEYEGWPRITDDQLIAAIADVLAAHSAERGKGRKAHLKLLMRELQDRMNLIPE
jgi:hypothetical protein